MALADKEKQLKELEDKILNLEKSLEEANRQKVDAEIRKNKREIKSAEEYIAKQKETIEGYKNEVSEINTVIARVNSLAGARQRRLDAELDAENKIKAAAEQKSKYTKSAKKLEEDYTKSFAKLDPEIKKILQSTKDGYTALASITSRIVQLEKQKATADEDKIEKINQQQEGLGGIRESMLEQVKNTVDLTRELLGTSEHYKEIEEAQERREKFEQSIVGLTKKQREDAERIFQLTENQIKQQKRLKEISEISNEIFQEMPAGFQKSFGAVKKLVLAMGPLALIGGLLAIAFEVFKDMDEAAKDFRKETGLTNSQTKDIAHDAHEIAMEFADIGANASTVFDIVKDLKAEFSDVLDFSKETVSALVVLNKNFGIGAESLAKVQQQFESIGGLSQETAASAALQVANMANLAGVAPKDVFKDIADNAEVTSKFFHGDINALARASVEARRLGTNIKDIADTAKQLLDFETSIEDELSASAMVGADINFQKARELAYNKDLIGAQNEILNQIEKVGDFRELDLFQQESLAKAAGMEVGEIEKLITNREKLNSLSGQAKRDAEAAIKNGLDLSNINKEDLESEVAKYKAQQEQQATLEKLEASFMKIIEVVGGTLSPILQGIATTLEYAMMPIQFMLDGFMKMGTTGKVLLSILTGLYVAQKAMVLYQRQEAVLRLLNIKRAGITAALSALSNPAKALIGLAAAAMIYGAVSSYTSKAGDVISPAKGKTKISTKEGGIYELSPNDDVVAAPGLINRIESNMGAQSVATIGAAAVSSPVMYNNAKQLPITRQSNLASRENNQSLSINQLLNEISGLRADLVGGKVRTYIDNVSLSPAVALGNNRNPITVTQS